MKCLALYRGRVTCVLRGGTRIVNLWRPYKQNEESIVADMNHAQAKGFKVGQLFESRVMKKKGQPAFLKVTKWTPKPLGPRTLARIRREVDEALSGIDWDNI